MQAFDPGVLFANPQRAAEAWLAASQTLLQGMQDVSKRHLMLQSALVEQAMNGALSFLQLAQPGAKPEAVTASVQQATETTMQSMREIMTAACKCSMDALAVYRDRMAGEGPAAAPCSGHGDLPRAAAE
jgi:hypothetical protein